MIGIIYILYNNENITYDSIISLKESIKSKKNFKILLVNNGSKNFDQKLLKIIDFKILIKKNIGFGGACNKGIDFFLKKKFSHIWLVNNDTVFNKITVNQMLDAINEYEIVTSPMVLESGIIETSGTGDVNFFLGRGFKNKKISKNYRYINLANVIFNSNIFLNYGKLDEKNFFLYWEDVDFCMRISNLISKTYITKQPIIHFSGYTTKKDLSTYLHFNSSATYFFYKHMKFPLYILPIMFGFLRPLKLLINFKFKEFYFSLRGILDGLRKILINVWQ